MIQQAPRQLGVVQREGYAVAECSLAKQTLTVTAEDGMFHKIYLHKETAQTCCHFQQAVGLRLEEHISLSTLSSMRPIG